MENLAGIVITYHPTKDFFLNIATYLDKVEMLIIADNSEPNCTFPEDFLSNKKIYFLRDGENKGIAIRLNQAAKIAINKGFQWLLTMDQDSFFEEKHIDQYLSNIALFEGGKKVAMFGVEHEKQPATVNDVFEEKTTLITSGSLLNLSLFRKIGGFDENLFIDEVDHEYCYRSIEKGFKIIKFKNIYLHHQLGEETLHHSLKNLKKTKRVLHSPIRLYYMVRNFLYVQKKYKHRFQSDLHRRKIDLLHRIKNNLLYGKNKLLLLKMISKSFVDFRQQKMGKFNR